MKSALVLGAGGFIGSHLVKRLKSEGLWVRGVDLKHPEFSNSVADEFILGDLRESQFVSKVIFRDRNSSFDEIYQLAADMGGAGFVFTGENDAEILHNSASINLNVLNSMTLQKKQLKEDFRSRVFYSSSACMYPAYNQEDPSNPNCREDSAYPANPDSEYGWEKLFSERLYLAFNRNYGIDVRVARYHNIFGPEGTWTGGREKAPAAICRKIAETKDGLIKIWGDGEQTRSFLYVDECIEATLRMMRNPNFVGPINIGSEEMVTINELVEITSKVAGKVITIEHVDGPQGVRGRNSSNDLARSILDWDYEMPLSEGIKKTYAWIKEQVELRDTF